MPSEIDVTVNDVAKMISATIEESIKPIHNAIAMDLISFRHRVDGLDSIQKSYITSFVNDIESKLLWVAEEVDMLNGSSAEHTASILKKYEEKIASIRSIATDWQRIAGQREIDINEAIQREKEISDKIKDLTSRTAIHPDVRLRIYGMTGGKCFYCGHELVLARSDLRDVDARRLMHIDHLVPRSCGGPDHETNFVPACEPCNVAKGDKHYVEFIRAKHPHLSLVISK